MEHRTTQQIAADAVAGQPYQFQDYEPQQNYVAPELSRKSTDDIEEAEESEKSRSRSSSDDTVGYAPINIPGEDQEAMRNNLVTLTRSQTNASYAGIDPDSKDFSLDKWLKAFIKDFDAEELKATRAGIVWKNLSVSGSGAALQLQDTVGGIALKPLGMLKSLFSRNTERKHILRNFNGNLKSGELLIVLGRPGSGCSTFLKSLCGETHGLHIDEGSEIHYNGVSQKQMMKEFKGEVVYNQEVDKHFPHLVREANHFPYAEICHDIAAETHDGFLERGGSKESTSSAYLRGQSSIRETIMLFYRQIATALAFGDAPT
ncbi:unnamed protein product [Aureobasidium mustum]|uniref:ABC transporter domain-containing protein n=1 Tax=Aureobasidium mustum TaxID=2773714 RepID=A0A9N8PLI6_9PEZI|nr:unnamed protein product [Aureobasidium mustum]